MYFDLEFVCDCNPGLDGEELVRSWINVVAGKGSEKLRLGTVTKPSAVSFAILVVEILEASRANTCTSTGKVDPICESLVARRHLRGQHYPL